MSKRTTYKSSNCAEIVFDKAKTVHGKDPSLYRKDPYGTVIYKHSYGRATPMGWDVDHIRPASRGGSDDIRNLQALNSHINRAKGNSLVKRSRHNQ